MAIIRLFCRSIIFSGCLLVFLFGCKKESKLDGSLPNDYSNHAVGASANDLLSGSNYSSLIIEVQYMPGYSPDAAALTHFQSLLSNTLNKSSGISVVQKQIGSGNKSVYSLADIEL